MTMKERLGASLNYPRHDLENGHDELKHKKKEGTYLNRNNLCSLLAPSQIEETYLWVPWSSCTPALYNLEAFYNCVRFPLYRDKNSNDPATADVTS